MSSEEPDQEEPPRRLPVSGPLNQPEQPYPSRDRDAGTSDASGLIVPGEEVEPKPRRAVRLTDRDRRILTLLTLLGVMDARQLQVHFTRLSPITRTQLVRMQGVQKRLNELRDAGYVEVSTLNGRNLYSTTPEGAALVCPEFAGEEEQSESPSLHTLVVSSVVTRYMNAGFDVVTERELRRAGAEGGYAVVSSERKHHHPDAVALAGGWGLDLAIEVELTRKASYRYLHRFHAYRNGRYSKVQYWVLTSPFRRFR